MYTDPATAKAGRRLHIEFDCPFDPSQVGRADHERVKAFGEQELHTARQVIASACHNDDRFAALVQQSGLVYEFVYRYGMGALLMATAGQSGDLTWR